MKQAVAPRQPLPVLWHWLETTVKPDIAALTEARVPKSGIPDGWSALFEQTGIGPRRRWGTILAGRDTMHMSPVCGSRAPHTPPWAATLETADIEVNGSSWATVVAAYALTVRTDGTSCGHGGYSLPVLLDSLSPLLVRGRAQRLVIAGDFNLWPDQLPLQRLSQLGLVELGDHTAGSRPPLDGCCGCTRPTRCGHLWTHRNGNKPGAAHQQIDFVLVSEDLLPDLRSYGGGIEAFPDAWLQSDHAPLFADFAI